MSRYLAKVTVTLKKSILDPQGKAVYHSLKSLGVDSVLEVRIGKYIELTIEATSLENARLVTETACKKLPVNPVMEDFDFSLEKLID